MKAIFTARLAHWLLVASASLLAWPAAAQSDTFSFGVIAHSFKAAPDESILRDAIAESDADNLAFVVANGIKASVEPCSDAVYLRRKTVLNSAQNGLVVSLAGSDWTDCKNRHGKSAAMERLNRIRELFFSDDFSFGSSRIPLVRQSMAAKFHSYAENARWEIGNIMFATVDLPAGNNHYRPEAGRNSEFEDRLIANRDWLQRIFAIATHKKMAAIILFCDGNPLIQPGVAQKFDMGVKRDGFAEVRQFINTMSAKFPGKVLVVHGQAANRPAIEGIRWRNNLGNLGISAGWVKLTVNPASPGLFSITSQPAEAKKSREQPTALQP